MHKHLWMLYLVVLFACTANAQPSGPSAVRFGATLPATCTPGSTTGSLFFRTTAGPVGELFKCTAPNTWTAAGGVGGAFPAGSLNDIDFTLNGTTFGADTGNFEYIKTALSTPAAPTVTPSPTGATSWSYACVSEDLVGYSTPSAATSITNGPAALAAMATNSVTCAAATGATTIRIYRTAAGGTPTTTGPIGTVSAAGGTLIDTGLLAPATFGTGLPSGNTSAGFFLNKYFRQGDLGDVENASYWGTPRTSFPAPLYGLLGFSKNNFAHYGTSANIFDNLQVTTLTTDQSINGLEVFNFQNIGAPGDFGANAIEVEYGNLGPNDSSQEVGVYVSAVIGGAGGIGVVNDFMADPFVNSTGAGVVTTYRSFYSDQDVSAAQATTAHAFESALNGRVGAFSFYSSGSAAIGLPVTTFMNLIAYADAALVFCSDCTNTSNLVAGNTCAMSGNGALAVRVNGAWKCFN